VSISMVEQESAAACFLWKVGNFDPHYIIDLPHTAYKLWSAPVGVCVSLGVLRMFENG